MCIAGIAVLFYLYTLLDISNSNHSLSIHIDGIELYF